jgi:hypothetical protein
MPTTHAATVAFAAQLDDHARQVLRPPLWRGYRGKGRKMNMTVNNAADVGAIGNAGEKAAPGLTGFAKSAMNLLSKTAASLLGQAPSSASGETGGMANEMKHLGKDAAEAAATALAPEVALPLEAAKAGSLLEGGAALARGLTGASSGIENAGGHVPSNLGHREQPGGLVDSLNSGMSRLNGADNAMHQLTSSLSPGGGGGGFGVNPHMQASGQDMVNQQADAASQQLSVQEQLTNISNRFNQVSTFLSNVMSMTKNVWAAGKMN